MAWWDETDDPTPAGRVAKPELEEAAVVREAQHLLDGQSGERIALGGEPVPGWAWLNALAHRCPDDLRDLTRTPGESTWGQSVAIIARWLVKMSPATRRRVQTKLFVSLELGALAQVDWLPDIEQIAWSVSDSLVDEDDGRGFCP